MTEAEIRQLASEWIAFGEAQNPALERKSRIVDDDPRWKAWSRLLWLTADDWPTTLAVCIEIANQSNNAWVLENLGAGPLEDLLEVRGMQVIEPFLRAAKDNPSFRQALRSVWECSDREVWERFLRVRDYLTN